MVNDKLSTLVQSQFPSFYKEEGPLFISFVEAYYEYLEQQGKMTDRIRNLQSYQDIATTTDEFINYFISSFLPSVPKTVVADKKLMVKYIKEFNQARGTLAAYKLLFRALYNEDVEVNFPSEQILKVSDGDWRKDRYLIVSYDPRTFDFIGKQITGYDSRAEALVEDVIRRTVAGRDMSQLILSNIAGTFEDGEKIVVTGGTDYQPYIQAGIYTIDMVSTGAEYQLGDVVKLISKQVGRYAKAVITGTQDLNGTISYTLVSGGSGYTATGINGTQLTFTGGDGNGPLSFVVRQDDLIDLFGLAFCTTLMGGTTQYGENGPVITNGSDSNHRMDTFANTIIGATTYGFREEGESTDTFLDYHDQANSILILANTSDPGVVAGDILIGESSGANCVVNEIRTAWDGSDVILDVSGYRQFDQSTNEKVRKGDTTVGTINTYTANTIGHHELQVGLIGTVTPTLQVGDELKGLVSDAYCTVQKIVEVQPNAYSVTNGGVEVSTRDMHVLKVSANSTASIASQFDTGPMKSFLEGEGIRRINTNETIGNAHFTTSNSVYENVYTSIEDSILFETEYFGTIGKISLPVGGSGYSIAPTVELRENDIAALGIGEQYITLETDDPFWGTGQTARTGTINEIGGTTIVGVNTLFESDYYEGAYISFTYDGTEYNRKIATITNDTTLTVEVGVDDTATGLALAHYKKLGAPDTNDRIVQGQASGDVKGGEAPLSQPDTSIVQYTFTGFKNRVLSIFNSSTNTTKYRTVVRVWQDFLQRDPGNITYTVGDQCSIKFYNESYTPGLVDTRSIDEEGSATVVSIDDRGILGTNAKVSTDVGADGTISKIRILDSGFGYVDGEEVTLSTPDRVGGVSGVGTLNLRGVANSEGYYATSRSQLNTIRGFIQDSDYYQEYSYDIQSAIPISKYRDYVLKLAHPAGQRMFGSYVTTSNASVETTANAVFGKLSVGSGTIKLTEGSAAIVGTSTAFTTEFAVGDLMTIDVGTQSNPLYYELKLNSITDDQNATATVNWANDTISSVTTYYNTGLINGDV